MSTRSMILSLIWLDDEKILVCESLGLMKLIDAIAGDILSEFILPPSDERRCANAAIIRDKLLICGDRHGTVSVFKLHSTHRAKAAQVFHKIHSRLGVQSLFYNTRDDTIFSTGRDGTLRFYEIRNDDGKNAICRPLHSKKMPMSWVARIFETRAGDIYVLGFKHVICFIGLISPPPLSLSLQVRNLSLQDHFVVYSTSVDRIVWRFHCGGGHRSWDCTIIEEKIKFVYINKKRIREMDDSLESLGTIRNGFHTKVIYSLEAIPTSGNDIIIISGSEDCTLRLSRIRNTETIETIESYDAAHVSNVKSAIVLDIAGQDSSLVFSAGGRAQLKVWQTSFEPTIRILESYCYMLHSSESRNRDKSMDIETRFMDMSALVYPEDKNFVILFTACSDGLSRIFLYDTKNNILHPSDSVNYCKRCILKVHWLMSLDEILLLTMTTDGFVSFWPTSQIISSLVETARRCPARRAAAAARCDEKSRANNEPLARIKIHQSGINSFDSRKLNDSQGRHLLLTGGDDNFISLVEFEIISSRIAQPEGQSTMVRALSKWGSSDVHSAQITGNLWTLTHMSH